MSRETDERRVRAFDALSDPRRLRALRFIAHHDPSGSGAEEPVCACHVQDHLGLSQPATSYHMKILREAGLVSAEKRGRWVHYHVSRDGVEALRSFVAELIGAARPASDAVA